MIQVSVDEAAAYDMLAILDVKWLHVQDEALDAVVDKLTAEIELAIGESRHWEICQSPEYWNLFAANRAVFEAIDAMQIHETPGDATKIDRLNHERYLCKRALQERFFPTKLTERKIGYDRA